MEKEWQSRRVETCWSGIERKQHGKSAALSGGAFDLDFSTVGFGNGLGDAEPEPGAPFALRASLDGPEEALKYPLSFLAGKADPRIRDLE